MTPSPDPPKIVYSLASGSLMGGVLLVVAGLWLTSLGNYAGIYSALGAAILMLLKIRNISTRITETGVSQLTLRGRIHLSWNDVTRVTRKPLSLTLAGAKGRVVVSVEEYSDSAAAIAYLESHLPANLRSD